MGIIPSIQRGKNKQKESKSNEEPKTGILTIRGIDCFLVLCDWLLCWWRWRGCQITTEKTQSQSQSLLSLSLLGPWPTDWASLKLFSIRGFLKQPTFQRLMSLLGFKNIFTTKKYSSFNLSFPIFYKIRITDFSNPQKVPYRYIYTVLAINRWWSK